MTKIPEEFEESEQETTEGSYQRSFSNGSQEEIKQAVDSPMDQLQSDAPAPSPRGMQASALSQDISFVPPQPPSYQQPYSLAPSPRNDIREQIEEISESIINEKWEDLMTKLGDISIWKENVRNEIVSIKQEVVRINGRFENLQNSVIGKVREYNKNIEDIGTDMKALEKVFEKIIEPLTTNIRELNKVTEKLKGNK